MKDITLGFKALDVHELTCHFVAQHAGLYAERGLNVKLLDTRRIPDDELPEEVMSAACGSALLRWLHGERLLVVFVAAARPMFWLYCCAGIERLDDLAGGRVAGYSPAAPPAAFLRLVLEEAGLDLTVVAAGDDAARLSMLRSGEAVAALVSSATLPRTVDRAGFRRLLCLGEHLQVPTTGLAVQSPLITKDPDAVHCMRDALAAALRIIHGDKSALREALRQAAIVDDDDLDSACSLVREFYSMDGSVRAADILPGVQRLAKSMNLPEPAGVDDLYSCAAAPAKNS